MGGAQSKSLSQISGSAVSCMLAQNKSRYPLERGGRLGLYSHKDQGRKLPSSHDPMPTFRSCDDTSFSFNQIMVPVPLEVGPKTFSVSLDSKTQNLLREENGNVVIIVSLVP